MNAFFKGLIAAVSGGVLNAVFVLRLGGHDADTEKAAVIGALIGGVAYLVGHAHGQDVGGVGTRPSTDKKYDDGGEDKA